MTTRRSLIAGAGGHLPAELIDNHALAARLDTSDEWIVSRTGIRQRYRAPTGQNTSDLAAAAADAALRYAGVDADAIDGILVATATPDRAFPATAAKVQAMLGIRRGFAFDVSAACAGYIAALLTADGFLNAGRADCMLVIGAETFMRLLDPTDRSTAVLFGDGAGAMVLRAEEAGSSRGIVSGTLETDGRLGSALYLDADNLLRMNGREVYRHAIAAAERSVRRAIAGHIETDAIAALVPHQANQRITHALAEQLALPIDRMIDTVGLHANTSAASIPLAWSTAQHRFAPGANVVFAGMGAGFSAGAVLWRT